LPKLLSYFALAYFFRAALLNFLNLLGIGILSCQIAFELLHNLTVIVPCTVWYTYLEVCIIRRIGVLADDLEHLWKALSYLLQLQP